MTDEVDTSAPVSSSAPAPIVLTDTVASPAPVKEKKLNAFEERLRDELSHLELEIKKATGNVIPDSLSFVIAKIKDMVGIPPNQSPSPEVKI